MLVAWAMAFQMFSAVCLWVKTPTKRRGRIVPAILTYSVLAAIPGITLLAMRPQLLWWAIAFAPLASSALFPRVEGARALPGCPRGLDPGGRHHGPVAFALATADGSPAAVTPHAWAACTVFTLHYVGTVPLVRSMIRGRKDPRWAMGAALFHACCTLGVTAAWWFGALSIWPPRVGVPDGARVGDADAEPHPKASPLPQVDRLHRDRLVGSAVRGAADPITASACRVGVSD